MIEKIVQTAKHIVKERVESQSARLWCTVLEVCGVHFNFPEKTCFDGGETSPCRGQIDLRWIKRCAPDRLMYEILQCKLTDGTHRFVFFIILI